ncbi:hypothetical protein HDU97_001790 [Phlyctochytrium planicorne]|nr:hypothetical protein HDU97_001790 [Phlyctochytrium planicorne]
MQDVFADHLNPAANHKVIVMAVESYNIIRADERHRYLYFKKFKMKFYAMSGISSETLIADDLHGVKMSAVKVVGACLFEVKNAALQQIRNVNAGIRDSDVLWILTVPAIWKDGAKRLMRDAAVVGGLITAPNSASLMLALEPEDCGGGTIDVTVHEVSDSLGLKVKERIPASGGDWGSTAIDRAFWKMVEAICGSAEVATSRKECPRAWHQIERDWEVSKCSFRGKNDIFSRLPQGNVSENLEEKVDCYNSDFLSNVCVEEDVFFLPASDFKKLCKDSIDQTIKHVQWTLDRCPNASKLFAVGNFAQSHQLQEAFKDALGSKLEVVIPADPGVSVVIGVVVIGNSPQKVEERVAPAVYGTSVFEKFIPGVHREEYKTRADGGWMCNHIANWFVECGERIPCGRAITRPYYAIRRSQTSILFDIFEGLETNIIYTNDPRQTRLLGSICTHEVDSNVLYDEGTHLTILFGHSETFARVVDPRGGVNECTIQYR